jgi:DnaK suppressor protein
MLNATPPEWAGVEEILKQKAAGLAQFLANRDGIAIEKSADQMDEIQYATERDLAIRNVDRDSTLLRQVKAALVRLQSGLFGNCTDCEEPISAKRLAAIPWASRCIQCQEVSDRDGLETNDDSENLINAA